MKKEQVRFDHLTEQYIWSLENDASFVRLSKDSARRGLFAEFRRRVGQKLKPIREMVGESESYAINGYEWSFLYLELWKRMGGPGFPSLFNTSNDLAEFTYQVERAATVDMFWAFSDGFRPEAKQFNPCAEIPLGNLQPCALQEPEGKLSMNDHTTGKIANPVKMAPAFETKNYIFGNDVETMSEEALIQAIKRVEEQISDLKTVKTKSVKISANITKLQEQLALIVAELDAR